MGTSPALEAADELEQDAVEPVSHGGLGPLPLLGVFLAFVHQKRFQNVTSDWVTWKEVNLI